MHGLLASVVLILLSIPCRSRPQAASLQDLPGQSSPVSSTPQQPVTITQSLGMDRFQPVITLIGNSTDSAGKTHIHLSSPGEVPLSRRLSFSLRFTEPFPDDGQIEVRSLVSGAHVVLTLAPAGGLIQKDERTVVATLNPESSFGKDAHGPLQLRVVSHQQPDQLIHNEHERPRQLEVDSNGEKTVIADASPSGESSTSGWVPLATLVRLPDLTGLACPVQRGRPCVLRGSNLALLQAVSADPEFRHSVAISASYNGTMVPVPHANGGQLFLKLRDNPDVVTLASFPSN